MIPIRQLLRAICLLALVGSLPAAVIVQPGGGGAGAGAATNAVAAVAINGSSVVAAGATNLTLWAGPFITLNGTNTPAGKAHVTISAAGISNASTLYLAPDGNDATAKIGRPDKPWATFSNACAVVTNDQTIIVMPGRYTNLCATIGGYACEGKFAYRLANVTNVLIRGVGYPSICQTSPLSGLVIISCDKVTVEGLQFEGRWQLEANEANLCTHALIEPYFSTNLLVQLNRFSGGDFGIAHMVGAVGGYANTNDTAGVIVRHNRFSDFGMWVVSQNRWDGAGIASGGWTIEDNEIYDSNHGIEPYPFAAAHAMSVGPRISRNKIFGVLKCGIGSSFWESSGGEVADNWIANPAGFNFHGTNALSDVSGIWLREVSTITVRGNTIDGMTNAFRVESGTTNAIFWGNTVTNCIGRFSSTVGVVQDEALPLDTSGFGKVADTAGLKWPDDSAFMHSSALQTWFLGPVGATTNRQAFVLGNAGDLGFGLYWDDYDGTSWHTLSLYDTLGPDLSGFTANFRSKSNFAEQVSVSGNGYFGGSLYLSNTVTLSNAETRSIFHVPHNQSVGIGYFALANSTSGEYNDTTNNNVAIGYEAGRYVTTGQVTAVGYQAARLSTNGVITAMGRYAGMNNVDGHLTAFGNAAARSSISTESVCVGDESGGNNVSGQITTLGYYAGNATQTNNGVTAIGYLAGTYASNNEFTVVGDQVGQWNTGELTAIGYQSAYSNTTASAVAVGHRALYSNRSGSAVGIGWEAGWNNNSGGLTAVGYEAAKANKTGNSTCLGYSAGYKNESGTIISIGRYSGFGLTYANAPQTDNDAILIGNYANRSVASATQLTNYITIGAYALADKANQVKLGNDWMTETLLYGAVGIGTNSPQAQLHVVGNGSMENLASFGTTAADGLVTIKTNGTITAVSNSVTYFRAQELLLDTNRLAIGTNLTMMTSISTPTVSGTNNGILWASNNVLRWTWTAGGTTTNELKIAGP